MGGFCCPPYARRPKVGRQCRSPGGDGERRGCRPLCLEGSVGVTEEQRPTLHHEEVDHVRWDLEGRARPHLNLAPIGQIEFSVDHGHEVDDTCSRGEVEALDHLVEVVAQPDLRVHGVALHAEFLGIHFFDGSASVPAHLNPLVGELGEESLGVLVHVYPFVQGICGQIYTSTFCGFVNVGDKERIR